VPEIRNGKITGWRLYDVDTVLARSGVVEGDVLVAIDERPAAKSLHRCLDEQY